MLLQLGYGHACFKRAVLSFGIFCLVVSSIGVPALADSAEAKPQSSAPQEAEVLQRVVDAIRENYRKLPHLSCKIQQTALHPSVKERRVVRGDLKGKDGKPTGGQFVYTEEPQTTHISEVLVSGESLRVDRKRLHNDEESHESFHNGVYCSVSLAHKWASFHFFKDMPGLMNRDPREVGSSDQKKTFAATLLESRLVKHESITIGDSKRLVLHLERDVPRRKEPHKWRCEVDPQRGYLPYRVIYYVSHDPKNNGKINSVQDVEYQLVPGCNAWFLKKSVLRFYHPKYAEIPGQDGWHQQITDEVQGPVQILAKVDPKRFHIEIPPEVEVRDQTRGERQGDKVP